MRHSTVSMLAGPLALMMVGCAFDPAMPPPAAPPPPTIAYAETYAYMPAIPPIPATPPPPPPPPTRVERMFASLPPYRDVSAPSRQDLIARWQLPPTNVWARYEKYTLLTALDSVPRTAPMPDISQLAIVSRAQQTARCLAAGGLPGDTMWIVDARGAASVAFGAAMSEAAREPVSLVLTFNNWPAENELIPAEEALAALIAFKPKLPGPRDAATRPVFLLDSWRLAYRFDVPDDDVTDNRYVLGPTDLPDIATLRARGITRIVYVVEDRAETPTEEDDLYLTFRAYEAAGIGIFLIDMNVCEEPVARGRINEVLAHRFYVCEERHTIFDDSDFYIRAHGGFGGVHVGPPGGAHWGGGGG